MNAFLDIAPPRTAAEWECVGQLVEELIDWDALESRSLGFDRAEVEKAFYPDTLKGIQAHSTQGHGALLLARVGTEVAGCAAFKRLSASTCELYSVYVRPQHRCRGIASILVERLKQQASAAGYLSMYLETATFMRHAHAVYREHRFVVRDLYRSLDEKCASVTIAMQCDLTS